MRQKVPQRVRAKSSESKKTTEIGGECLSVKKEPSDGKEPNIRQTRRKKRPAEEASKCRKTYNDFIECQTLIIQ